MVPATRYARNDGVHIAYQVWGEGEVDLVLVPGFVSHVEVVWELPAAARFLERLGAFARVVMFDRRGTGLSDPVTVTEAPTLETRMSDLRAVMDDVGLERAALLGQSEGVPMSILFAASHPERTTALVLVGGMARSTYAEDHPWLPTADDFYEAGLELVLPVWGTGVGAEVSVPSQADNPEVVSFYGRLERASISPGMLASVALMFYDTDVRDVLPTVQAPTLVIHRHGDRLVNRRSGQYLADNIPGARYVEMPGIAHVPWFETSDEILAEIEEFVTGRRPAVEPRRRLATVFFSDIVGSTERVADVGDEAWRELLDRHHRVVRAELKRFDGTEVKTLGDGFLATFDGPASAIRCALAIEQATASIGLAVRIGLHCGEIEVIDDDVGGLGVHIAARVAALAAGGEVLVSRTVKDLVAGSGITFESRGAHALKGVPDDWEIFAVAR
jgi:class 3 adenylate cyclase